MGQATSEQLRRLFFGDPSTATRRLAKLAALKLLDVYAPTLAAPNVYTLGTHGRTFLAENGRRVDHVHRARIRRDIDAHLRLLNEFRVELVLGSRRRRDVALRAFHADLDLRRAAGSNVPNYIPDAIVELSVGSAPLILLVEVDLGTEGSSEFSSKVQTTVELWQAGEACWGAKPGTWRPVALTVTSTRARALARCIVAGGGDQLWLLGEFDVLRERGAFGPFLATAEVVAATPRAGEISYQGALAPAPTNNAGAHSL